MRKYLVGLFALAFVFSATAAFAVVDGTTVTGHKAHKFFKLTCHITETYAFTVNIFNAAGTDLGELDTIGANSTVTTLGSSLNGTNLPVNMSDGTGNTTYAQVHVAWDNAANYWWSIHLVTDNSAYQSGVAGFNDKGGLIKVGATTATTPSSRLQVLYHAFATATPQTVLTAAEAAGTAYTDGWRWIQDVNNSNFLVAPTGNPGLTDSQIAYGNNAANSLNVNQGATGVAVPNGTFDVNFAGIVSGQALGDYEGDAYFVLRAQ